MVTGVAKAGVSSEDMIHVAADEGEPEWTGTLASLGASLEVEVESTLPMSPDVVWVRNPYRHANNDIFHVRSQFEDGPRLVDYKTCCGWWFGFVATVIIDVFSP